MSIEDIAPAILKFATALMSSGPVGWAIGGIAILAILFIGWRFRKAIRKAVQASTERKRNEAQAQNPVDNVRVENDATDSEQEIEEIIKKGDT